MCTCVYIHVHKCVSVYIHMYVCIQMCVYVCTYTVVCVFMQDSQINGSETQPGKSLVSPQPPHLSGAPGATASCRNSESPGPWHTALVRIT